IVHNWAMFGVALLCLVLLGYVTRLRDPRYMERAMARKLEKQKVADKVTAALEEAVEKGELSRKTVQKYLLKLGRTWDIPDLIPRNHQHLPFVHKPNLKKAKILCTNRL